MISKIINEILDPSVEITVILRKVKVLAYQLDLDELKEWVEHELNGYKDRDSVPDYRRYQATNIGNFVGAYGSQFNNIPIPLSNLPERIQEVYKNVIFRESIATIEKLSCSKEDSSMAVEWAADALRYLENKVYLDYICISARQVVGHGQLTEVLNAVRNRLLTFLLELDKQISEESTSVNQLKPISSEQARQVFNTFIIGNGNNVNSQVVNIMMNDINSLLDYVRGLGVSETELQELQNAISADGMPTKEEGFGSNIKKWLGVICSKTIDVTANISIEQIIKAIVAYYGW